jgi:cytochrome c oxidase assembly protein subunit 15
MYINLMSENNKNIYMSSWLLLVTLLVALMIIVGGLTRLTDSGLSITKWQLFSGFLPPLNDSDWKNYFNLYKEIPEFKLQNFSMTLNEFKIIFWWEWAHRFLGRLIGICFLLPLLYFTIKLGFKNLKKLYFIFFLICFQGFIGWYMVSSGLVDRVDVSHYRLALHLLIAFFILSLVLWDYFKVKNIDLSHQKLKFYFPLIFLILIFIQITVGAFVSGMDAGTIYNTWPLMGTSYFPDDNKIMNILSLAAFDDPSLVQFFHRNLAYIILIYYLILTLKVYRNNLNRFFLPIKIIGLFLIIQVVLGIFTLLYGAQIYLASMHQISSIFLICSSLYFLYLNSNIS